jgi:mRNA-degrading endonuclease RelE of RelBE toxin-antitoxin system
MFVGWIAKLPCAFLPHSMRFAETGEGDIRKLAGDSCDLRLRVGDYRVCFTEGPDDTLQVHAVRHRSEAYR